MADRSLHETFERALAKARAAPRTAAPSTDALDALALVLVLEVEGALPAIAAPERALLRSLAARVLAAPARAEDDGIALGLARAGLAVLGDRATTAPASALHATDRALVAMRSGAPEPLVAAAVAAHVRGCSRCGARLRLLRMLAPWSAAREHEPLRAAAEAVRPMRAPAEGRAIGARAELGVEAVVFDDARGEQRLAVYARDPVAVRLVGPGLVTEQTAPGYWLGRLDPTRVRLDTTLHLARRRIRWRLEVGTPPRAPRRRAPRRR